MASKTRTVARKKATEKALDIATHVRQFLTLRVQSEALDERLGVLKKDIQTYVETHGYEDDKGHYWFELDEPVDVAGFGACAKLKRERRVSQKVDPDRAEDILQKKGIYDDCTTTITVLDEEAIRVAHFKGLLSDSDIDAIFPSKVTWAFRPVK